MARSALIVGVTGIVGRNLAEHLLATGGWSVEGIARHPEQAPHGVAPIAVDLRDAAGVRKALARTSPSHVFLTTWLRQPIGCARTTKRRQCSSATAWVAPRCWLPRRGCPR